MKKKGDGRRRRRRRSGGRPPPPPPPASKRPADTGDGWLGWLVGSAKFISEEKRRERERPAGRSRQEQAGAGRTRKETKKKKKKKEEEKCNHHELAVGYHCQGAIETRRSRLELARRRVKTRHLGRRCPHAAVGQKTRAGTAKTRERERETVPSTGMGHNSCAQERWQLNHSPLESPGT